MKFKILQKVFKPKFFSIVKFVLSTIDSDFYKRAQFFLAPIDVRIFLCKLRNYNTVIWYIYALYDVTIARKD